MGGIVMKCKELMIGDWVKIKGHLDYDKVQEIARDESMQWYISFACSATLFRAYEFEPIPLTSEILEKNGFIKVNSQRYDYGYPDTDCYVKVNPKKNMIHVNGRNANSNLYSHSFVHELQRALRLCGLDELADNFKVYEK